MASAPPLDDTIYATTTPLEVKATGAEAWHCTRVKLTKFRYMWKIENFSFLKSQRTSPEFIIKDIPIAKWKLHILEEDSYLFIKLLKNPCGDHLRIRHQFEASIINADGKVGCRYASDVMLSDVISIRLISMDDLLDTSRGLLPLDALTIVCDITAILDTIDIVPRKIGDVSIIDSNRQQREDLSQLLETGKFSDVTFVVANKEFKAHKAILTVRSEVFAAMFDHEGMDENKKNRVEISDFEPTVIQEMLTFIYSNRSPNVDEMAADLLPVADKYALHKLKIMCEFVLHRDLRVDTAIETLILADRHGAAQLREQALSVIKENISAIIKTDAWQNICQYPHLVTEIVSFIACT
ncbi:speckle-type POZ protein [Stomoxys calcitrans]|uniref:BTB domain-containing protein n=1 Tax=Stomoxys calcitrans TaxID=35570 RepID=A0A1I8Q798_STOCA|nr:speckle-type POZ protein [Stomoxys calcitrans]